MARVHRSWLEPQPKDDEFRLIHVVLDDDGKLLRMESEKGNVLFISTNANSGELVMGIPTETRKDLSHVREKVNTALAKPFVSKELIEAK